MVKFPHLHGKIPREPSYGVFTSQLLRFCEVNGTINNFYKDIQDMIKIFVKQGFDKLKLMGHYKLFCINITVTGRNMVVTLSIL